MTKEQLETMFLAEEAWDKQEVSRETIAQLIEVIGALTDSIVHLNELLAQ